MDRENYDYELMSISFSGSKGFHLFYNDPDRSLFSIEDGKEEDAVRKIVKIAGRGFTGRFQS